MRILTPLSEWKTTKVERGRTAGEEIKTRWVLALDNWNWIIARQTGDENGSLSNMHYYQNFKILIISLQTITGISHDKLIPRIVGALKRGMNVNMEGKDPPPSDVSSRAMGAWIDDTFDASFAKNYPPRVYKRLFPTDAQEDND